MVSRLSIASLLDLLLPRACLLCGGAASAPLCRGCVDELPRLVHPACPVCAMPLPLPAPACGDCLKTPPAFDATFAALRYAFPVDRLVQSLKFGGHHAFRRLASADFLAASLLETAWPTGDVIIPVPLAPLRLRERGFNQALEIAHPLARALRLPLDAATLVRVRETLPQSRLPWRARQGNMRHAFNCHSDLSGREIIVVDDVMTTGATLDAVARTLKDHGAARVTNWIAARVVKGTT
jgi:ComF family protein